MRWKTSYEGWYVDDVRIVAHHVRFTERKRRVHSHGTRVGSAGIGNFNGDYNAGNGI